MLVLISFACHCYLRASLFFFCFGWVFLGKLSFWLASHLCYTLLLRLTYLTLPYFSFITCNSELLTAIYFSRNSLMSSLHAFLLTCHLVLGNIAHIQLVLSLITPPRSVLKSSIGDGSVRLVSHFSSSSKKLNFSLDMSESSNRTDEVSTTIY